jgi:hypothetical protein
VAKNLQEVLSYSQINVDIEDPRVDSFSGSFSVKSTRDFGAIQLRVKSIGAECFGVPGVSNNLCDDPYDEVNLNPFLRPRSLPLSISDVHGA